MSTATLFDRPATVTPPKPAKKLWPHQLEALRAVKATWDRGIQRTVMVQGTGGGKTFTCAHMIRYRIRYGRVLVFAHTKELLAQWVATLQEEAPELRVGVFAGGVVDIHGDVVVASMQTLSRPEKMQQLLASGPFATVIADECHRAAGKSAQRMLRELGAWNPDGPRVLGVTATPSGRSDGVGLDTVFETIAFSIGLLELMAAKVLVDIDGIQIRTGLDLDRVTSSGGDFNDGSLGREIIDSGTLIVAADALLEHAPHRRTLAVVPTVEAAHTLAALLCERGFRAEAVSGQTPTAERTAIRARFASGETQVVTNAAVWTEGFDEPAVDCILLARPTKSTILFTQIVGRALRAHPGKKKALLLSLYAPPEAGLATLGDLSGDDSVKVREGESLAQAVRRTEVEELERIARLPTVLGIEQLSLFRSSGVRWLRVGEGLVLPAGDTALYLVPRLGGKWDVFLVGKFGGQTLRASGVDAERGRAIGEEIARSSGSVFASATAAWRDKPATPAQAEQLRKKRLPACANSGEASDELAKYFAAPIMRQLIATASTTGSAQ